MSKTTLSKNELRNIYIFFLAIQEGCTSSYPTPGAGLRAEHPPEPPQRHVVQRAGSAGGGPRGGRGADGGQNCAVGGPGDSDGGPGQAIGPP